MNTSRVSALWREMQEWTIAMRMNMALALAHSAAIDNGSAMLDAGFFDTVAGYEVYFIFGAAHRAEQLKQCVLQLVPNPGNCRVVKHGDGATPLAGLSDAGHAGTDQAR